MASVSIGFDGDTADDDEKLFFGSDQDYSISYDSTDDRLEVTDEATGDDSIRVDGGNVEVPSGRFEVSGGDIRLATGQAFEDGGGTARFDIQSDRTRVYDDSGTHGIQLRSGVEMAVYARSAEPFRIVDSEMSSTAVEYSTSSSAPGTLELTNSLLELNGNNIRTPNKGQSNDTQNMFISQTTSGDTTEWQAIDGAGNATVFS